MYDSVMYTFEMTIRARENIIGAWAFLIGVTLAILGGVLSSAFGGLNTAVLSILLVLGVIVGFVNVSPADMNQFLTASVSLVIVSFAGSSGIRNLEFLNIGLGEIIAGTLGALLVLLVPATIIVVIKSLFSISQG
jgi:hypothetical protein